MPTYSDFWFRIILKIRSWWYIIHNIWPQLIVILHQYPGPNTKLDQHSHLGAKCGKDESEFSITIQNEPHLLCKANLYVSSPLQYNINQQKNKAKNLNTGSCLCDMWLCCRALSRPTLRALSEHSHVIQTKHWVQDRLTVNSVQILWIIYH